MLEFTKLELEHIPLIRPFYWRQRRRICDNTIGGSFMWRDYFDSRYAIWDDTLAMKVRYVDGKTAFTVPTGGNIPGMLDQVKEYCAAQGIPLEFCTVTPADLTVLQTHFSEVSAEETRDWFDYLYESRDIVDFAGRKYSAQRNHIHKFERLHPDWSFERLDAGGVAAAKEFFRSFVQERTKDGDTAEEDVEKTFEVLDRLEEYGLKGGMLLVGGKIVGMSLGEIVRDTLFVHIEKADVAYPGVYQKLVNSFARAFVTDEVHYINREEDVGDPGLRKSKLSYHPVMLLEKYTVRVG